MCYKIKQKIRRGFKTPPNFCLHSFLDTTNPDKIKSSFLPYFGYRSATSKNLCLLFCSARHYGRQSYIYIIEVIIASLLVAFGVLLLLRV